MTRLMFVTALPLLLWACDKDPSENGNRVTAKADEIEAAAEAQVSDTENELKALEAE